MTIQNATAPSLGAAPALPRTPVRAEIAQPQDLTQLSGVGGPSTYGSRQAIQLAGIGVMFGGIMAAAALGGKWGPALMIGAMFGGLAIMALGNRD